MLSIQFLEQKSYVDCLIHFTYGMELKYGPYSPCMDILPETYALYGLYVTFLPEHVDGAVHIAAFEETLGRRIENSRCRRK